MISGPRGCFRILWTSFLGAAFTPIASSISKAERVSCRRTAESALVDSSVTQVLGADSVFFGSDPAEVLAGSQHFRWLSCDAKEGSWHHHFMINFVFEGTGLDACLGWRRWTGPPLCIGKNLFLRLAPNPSAIPRGVGVKTGSGLHRYWFGRTRRWQPWHLINMEAKRWLWIAEQ